MIPSFVTILTRVAKSSGSLMIADDSLATIEKILAEQPLPQTSSPKTPENYDIALENISFSYEDDGEKVLDHLSLTMKQGTITALVGESGGGKSTIASLIARFWDVQEGAVKIGGVDVRDLDYDAWMKHVSIVFQDTNLLLCTSFSDCTKFTDMSNRISPAGYSRNYILYCCNDSIIFNYTIWIIIYFSISFPLHVIMC